MTLEERIARALFEHSVPMLAWDEVLEPVREEWRIRARAVVAVLPNADVSDEAIREALMDRWLAAFPTPVDPVVRAACVSSIEWLTPAVRALLDAQAAAYAAEMEALREQGDGLYQASLMLGKERDDLRAEVEALRQSLRELSPSPAQMIVDERDAALAEVEALRTQLNGTQQALNDEVSRKHIVITRAERAEAEVEALRAEVERLRQRPNYVITNPAVYAVRQAEADRDRAVREALTKVAQMLHGEGDRESTGSRQMYYHDAATRVLHYRDSLIPGGTE